ncbi:MAG: hypothetical protein ABIJ57_00355 [Pseudomonadota bacterium]
MGAITPDKDGVTAARIAREETNRDLEAAGFTDKKIFTELAIISFSDVRQFVDEEGNLKKPHKISPLKLTKAIKKFKQTSILNTITGIERTVTEYECHDKLTALNMAIGIKGIKAPERIVYPDEHGNPQDIGRAFGETERSARIIFLLEQAQKRAEGTKK